MITLTRAEAQRILDVLEEGEVLSSWEGFSREANKLRDRLAEPEKEQEPVAWTIAGKITNWSQDFSSFKTKTYTRPVYAAPPQREWVGLTNEEAFNVYATLPKEFHPADFARAIEQRLKEKNT
jgi:hypothetical protein